METHKKHLINKLRTFIFGGLLVWLPILATYIIIKFIIQLLDQTLSLLPMRYQPDQILGFHLPGLGLIFTIFILLLTGFLVTNFIGHKLVHYGEKILSKIPLIRSIYSAVKQVLSALLQQSNGSFRKVLLIEYPKKDIFSIGFQTSSPKQLTDNSSGKLAVFIPTTPNPTSGFLVYVDPDQTVELDISVEEALRLIISLGVVSPDRLKPQN